MRITTNPSWAQTEIDSFRQSIRANDGYCPCRLEHKPEFKCMCEEFKKQESGQCHCGLYVKEIS